MMTKIMNYEEANLVLDKHYEDVTTHILQIPMMTVMVVKIKVMILEWWR